MVGMSLSYQHLLSTDDPALKPGVLLPKLWERGVRSVELRSVSAADNPFDVLRVANLLWDYGFNITVHSKAKSTQSAVNDVFGPLAQLLVNMRQRELVVTIHPIVEDNAAMLTALSDYIMEQKYPVCIALENNRKMPDGSNGDSVALVLDAVTRADRQNVGICFDMGHWAWYTANFTDSPNLLPPQAFLSRVIHTHIHAYAEGTTHFPLDNWREPFSVFIDALGYQYVGVYNVELDPHRFAHNWSATKGYLISADTLKSHYPARAAYYDELRSNYDGCFRRSMEVLDKKDGCYGTLLAPSAYLFSTNGYKWAMDIAFLTLYRLAETPWRIREYLGGIDCMILTHGHSDHFEERTICALCDTDIAWVVPDFLVDKLLSFGVRREKITSVCVGDHIQMGPLSIHVLEGKHFRPETGSGIETVGYLIRAENAPSLVFPADVRDYSVAEGENLDADHCFAHVWLTDNAINPEMYVPKSREFAAFMLSKSKKSILLAHLNITHRPDDKIWTIHHAHIARDAILEQSPETVVRVPKYGEIIEFSKT